MIPFNFDRTVREIAELVRQDKTGLMAGFIDQAITEFAKEVANMDPEQFTQSTNGFVNGHAWVDCAKQILAKRDEFASTEAE